MSTTNTPAPRVAGIDLSLTSTGIAVATADTAWTERITTARVDGLTRIRQIVSTVVVSVKNCDLAVLEGPAYSRQAQPGHHERAGLWWMVRDALQRRDIPVAVASPSARARYATGKGNASKAAVVREISRRYAWFGGEEDEADAVALMAMGRDHLGHPLSTVPATHRGALARVDWPDLLAVAA